MFTAACAIRLMGAVHAVVFFFIIIFLTHIGVEQVHAIQTLAPVDAALDATEGRFALSGARRGGCRDGARSRTGVYPGGVSKEKKWLGIEIRATKHTSQCCFLAERQSATGNTTEERTGGRKNRGSPFFRKATVPLLEKMTFREIYNWI